MNRFRIVTRHLDKQIRRQQRTLKPKIQATRAAALRNISRDAAVLGVTREHLSRVIHGHRVSASLTRRYRNLQQTNRLP